VKKSSQILPANKIFKDGDWPGGLIYKIITRQNGRKSNYTLLCWDGFNRNTARKTIESLGFDSINAVFGSPVFKTREGLKDRVVYEYSSQASFTMNYSRQKVILAGVRKSQSKIDDYMIVVDKLVPVNESLAGQNWAMIPAGNTNDAYIYLNGFWTFVEDIVARNPAPEKRQPKAKGKPEQGLFPKK